MEIIYLLSKDFKKKIKPCMKESYELICLKYFKDHPEEMKVLDSIIITDSYETYANYCNENYGTSYSGKNFQSYTGCVIFFNNFENAVLTVFIQNIDYYESVEQRLIHEFSHILFENKTKSNGLPYQNNLSNRFLDELHSYIYEYFSVISMGGIKYVDIEIKKQFEELEEKKKISAHILGTSGTFYPIVKITAFLYLLNDKTTENRLENIYGKEIANQFTSVIIDLKKFDFNYFSKEDYQNAIKNISSLTGINNGKE